MFYCLRSAKIYFGLLWWLNSKESACNAGDMGLIPGPGKSPEERDGYPLVFLTWEIAWVEEPGRLHFTGLQSWTRLNG